MATYRAVTAISNAIVHLLQSQYVPADFDGNLLEFRVYIAQDFLKPMDAGVSVLLYRIYPNQYHRTPPGRQLPDGRRQRHMLPMDLHFLLTAWAKEASLQHTIAGWMMRLLEDTPSLPPGLLNARYPDTFGQEETVEIGITELTTEELFRIWEVIVNNTYQVSVPYIARNVKIETIATYGQGEPVQERLLDYEILLQP